MKIAGQTTRSIWLEPDGWSVGIFDQRFLPWAVERLILREMDEAAHAIADMDGGAMDGFVREAESGASPACAPQNPACGTGIASATGLKQPSVT